MHTNTDTFKRLMIRSDPVIALTIGFGKKKLTELTEEMKKLLVLDPLEREMRGNSEEDDEDSMEESDSNNEDERDAGLLESEEEEEDDDFDDEDCQD